MLPATPTTTDHDHRACLPAWYCTGTAFLPAPAGLPAFVFTTNRYDKRQHTWFIENQPKGERVQVTVEDANDKVYLYKNDDAVIILEGRLKALTIVSCKQTQISFGDLMAVVEVNNCTSVKVQSLGKCPAMTIDKTNGCQVYLSRTSLDCNFVCAQSSEMNVNFPTGPEGTEEEEWIELPIPEQFQHKVKGLELTSEVSDLYSH